MTETEAGRLPGVWAAQRTFAGWTVVADERNPADTVASAVKLAELTGRTVTVQGLVVHP